MCEKRSHTHIFAQLFQWQNISIRKWAANQKNLSKALLQNITLPDIILKIGIPESNAFIQYLEIEQKCHLSYTQHSGCVQYKSYIILIRIYCIDI